MEIKLQKMGKKKGEMLEKDCHAYGIEIGVFNPRGDESLKGLLKPARPPFGL